MCVLDRWIEQIFIELLECEMECHRNGMHPLIYYYYPLFWDDSHRSLESSVADIIINSVFGILSVVGPSFRLGELSGRVH